MILLANDNYNLSNVHVKVTKIIITWLLINIK